MPVIEGYNYDVDGYSWVNNKIIYSGLFKKSEKSVADGSFKYIIDPPTGIEDKKIVEFSQSEKTEILNISKTQSMWDWDKARDVHGTTLKNGDDIYVYERYNGSGDHSSVYTYYTGSLPYTGGTGSENSNAWGHDNIAYFDIFILSLDKDGKYKWLKFFERNDKVKSGGLGARTLDWGSNQICIDDNNVHFIYSDAGERIAHCQIDEKGTTNKNILPGAEIKIHPSEGIQISNNAVVMPYKKSDSSGLIKITF